jgi:hypothetical protein
MLAEPVVSFRSADAPLAVLALAAVLEKRVNAPVAVFSVPVVLLKSAPAPVRPFVCFAGKSLRLRSRAGARARKAQLDSGTFAD